MCSLRVAAGLLLGLGVLCRAVYSYSTGIGGAWGRGGLAGGVYMSASPYQMPV